jgi:protein MpaA
VTPRELGRSRNGAPLVAPEQGERGGLLVFGAIHGDEPESAILCERFLSTVSIDRPLCVVPVVNPDGLARNHKDNAAGVDLNRNFAATNFSTTHPTGYFPGPHALSEPESAALAGLVRERQPSVIVAVHQPFACVNWDGPADEVAQLMGDACGLPLAPSLGYPTPGSFGSWAGLDLGIAVVTLELPRVVASWDGLVDALHEAWKHA